MQVRPTGPGPAKTEEGLTGYDGGQQGRAGHGRVPAGPVRAVLGTGEGLTGCDGGQHGRTGHKRIPAGPVRALYSKGGMKPPLKLDGQ